MVKTLLILITILITACTSKPSFDTSANKLDVSEIEIHTLGGFSGLVSSEETEEMCKSFVMNNKEVISFFELSSSISDREYGHDLTQSNCYVDGTLLLMDGSSGKWKIDKAGRGFISFTDGKVIYRYCNDCQIEAFYSL